MNEYTYEIWAQHYNKMIDFKFWKLGACLAKDVVQALDFANQTAQAEPKGYIYSVRNFRKL